jgi:hypothetical protein
LKEFIKIRLTSSPPPHFNIIFKIFKKSDKNYDFFLGCIAQKDKKFQGINSQGKALAKTLFLLDKRRRYCVG